MSEFAQGEPIAPPTSAAEPSAPAAAAEPAPPVPAEPPASRVAAALGQLDTLRERELAEHPDVYQRIHGELQSALATIDHA